MAKIINMAYYLIFIGALVVNVMSAMVVVYRCDSDGINCEYFQTWTFTNICIQIKEKNQIWSPFYGAFDPPLVCPISNKVTYQIKNGTFDVGASLLLYPLATDYQWKAIVVIYRCDSDGINCEYFQTWTFGNVCNQLKENDQLWSRWCSSFDPPMVCPINKVTYQMKNATIDVGAALLFYPIATDYQWKVNVKFYSDDIFVGSVMIEFYFFGYRKKIKSILKP
eukprot:XP_016664138.1 PREDICTED: uncharacterized protein LOC107885151 [Acyrthosiphon pisum]